MSHVLTSIKIYFGIYFFFNDTATTEIYTLSLHDALPILMMRVTSRPEISGSWMSMMMRSRSEEHTSELQSRQYLVCRLLLEKKKKQDIFINYYNKTKIHLS